MGREIMHAILKSIERLLTVVLLSAASMGAFLMGCFGANLLGYDLTTREMTWIALGGMALTYALYCAKQRIRYERLSVEVEDLELEKNAVEQEIRDELGVM